jgi:hypothetical protein
MLTEFRKQRSWKIVLVILIVAVMLLLIACGCRFWEPRAPERSFTPEDLLIDEDIVPLGWELTDPTFPAGDTLCTTECATRGFTVSDDESSIRYGGHDVYRYRSTGIARRTFEKVYLSATRLQDSASGWTYQSSIAERSHFGCHRMGGDARIICEWGAQYEEYIILFSVAMSSDEVYPASIEQIEEIVRAIDARMAEYLGKPLESGD